MADLLGRRAAGVLEANEQDVRAARAGGVAGALVEAPRNACATSTKDSISAPASGANNPNITARAGSHPVRSNSSTAPTATG